jgi:hypothetical protein
VSPVRYELGFYIPEDDILHSHCREHLKSYTAFFVLVLRLLIITSLFLVYPFLLLLMTLLLFASYRPAITPRLSNAFATVK